MKTITLVEKCLEFQFVKNYNYTEILRIILSYNSSMANTTLLVVIRNLSFGAISSLVSMSFFPRYFVNDV